MGKLLRDPGAAVLLGLYGLTLSLIGIGIAIAAIQDSTRITPVGMQPDNSLSSLSIVVLTVGGITLVLALLLTAWLAKCVHDEDGKRSKIGGYLRRAYGLRKEVLSGSNWNSSLKLKADGWAEEVQTWLDNNLPDHSHDFDLETITNTGNEFFYGHTTQEQSNTALFIECRAVNLREILRDIRR